ncbi:MAG: Fur family transcriptional regulator [Thermodesulfovibrionales bacterium]|jgi:Fur family peroxide stress response transcriptional regulator|nr:Fur family transcriptional regulator [Thermodesulfovibrionales bacterium]
MEKYKDTGLKLTPQRLAILNYLDGNKEHPSAEDIYRAVLKRFPTMSFATVYNTLETLRQRGGLLELTIDPDKKRFDPNTEHHHHLICVKCKRIVDIHGDYKLPIPNGERAGFEIIGNHIEFYGICPKCKKANSL